MSLYFQLTGATAIPTLEGCDGKLGRAKAHLKALDDEIAIVRSLHKHTVFVEDNPSTKEYVFKVRDLQPSDPDWGYIAGDCIHNLRSALDHLVFQLAILGQGRGLTDEEAHSCMFPIFTDRKKFKDASQGRLRLLRPGEQTRITELQPFNAGDPSIWSRGPGRYLPGAPASLPVLLGRLEEFDVIDKHRFVQATWRAAEWFNADTPPIPYAASTMFGGRLEDNAEVGRWRYYPPRPELPSDMDMDRYFPIGVALGEPPYMGSAVEQLTWLSDTVEMVISIFRPCITEGLPALPLSAVIEPR